MYTPPQSWRMKSSKYRFVGSMCSCGVIVFPARTTCVCGDKPKELKLSGVGKIESYSEIRAAPAGFVAPYVVGIVKTVEGARVPSQIVGPVEKIKTGAPVFICFRRLYSVGGGGILVFGFKFEVE